MLPGMLPSRQKQIEHLETLGESEVRYLLSDITSYSYAGNKFNHQIAKEWLAQKEIQRQDHLANENLLAVKSSAMAAQVSANAAAEQSRWAKWAAVIAMLAAIISARDYIISFFGGHL